MENFSSFFLHLDEAIIGASGCEFYIHSFSLLGDMDDFIRLCSNFTYVGQQLTFKLGDFYIGDQVAKIKSQDNDSCCLLIETTKNTYYYQSLFDQLKKEYLQTK